MKIYKIPEPPLLHLYQNGNYDVKIIQMVLRSELLKMMNLLRNSQRILIAKSLTNAIWVALSVMKIQ